MTNVEIINNIVVAVLGFWLMYHVGYEAGYSKGKAKVRRKINNYIDREDVDGLNEYLGR